jgi:hypothetical protein
MYLNKSHCKAIYNTYDYAMQANGILARALMAQHTKAVHCHGRIPFHSRPFSGPAVSVMSDVLI